MPASSKSVEKTGRDEFVALQITSHPLIASWTLATDSPGMPVSWVMAATNAFRCSVLGLNTLTFLMQYGSHEPVVSACLASRTNEAKNFGIFARHDFHSERAGDSDSDLLDETIRHDRQQLASLRAKELDKADKHSIGERDLFQTHRTVEVLLLDDVGGDAQCQHPEFADPTVD